MLRQKSPKPFAPNGCRCAVPCASRPTGAAPNSGHPWPSNNRRFARLSRCDARQPSRRGKSKSLCFYRDCVAVICAGHYICNSGFFFAGGLQEQKLPPSADDFCYGKSHQNHMRRTAAAARYPARLARHAPRRTRAIRGPRTIGACSPVGLRCSAAFKARKSKALCCYR